MKRPCEDGRGSPGERSEPGTYIVICIIQRSRVPGEIKSKEVELDPQPRRDHEQGGGAGLRKLDFFCFGLLLNSSATDIVFVHSSGAV